MRDLIDLADRVRARQAAARYDKPLPDPDAHPYTRPFWEAATEGRLVLQSCADCGEAQCYPRPWCAHCGSAELEWIEASGRGTLHSRSVVRRTVGNPEFEADLPYVTGYVDLEEGPRIYTRVTDCDVDEVAVGTAVEVVFEPVTDEVALPLFRPRD